MLCSPTTTTNSSQSKDFCSKVWDTCQTIPIVNTPFAPSLQGQAGTPVHNNATKLTKLWQSKTDFCTAFCGAYNNSALF